MRHTPPPSPPASAPPRRIRAAFRDLSNRLLEPLGLGICSRTALERGRRQSYRGALEHAKRLGLDPRTVIDVGVAEGTWWLYEAFPDARILLIEPVEEAEPHLRAIAARHPRAEYVIAAASSKPGRTTLNIHPDVERTSAYWECDYGADEVERREVVTVTLDGLRRERELRGPILMKLDVQGAELDVLDGAAATLEDTEYLILESCLFQFFAGAPLLSDIVAYMKARNFVVYDVASIHYRPLDDAVSTMDLVFVKESSRMRREHRFRRKKPR